MADEWISGKLRGRITFSGPLRSKNGWTHEAISFHSAIDELPGIHDSHYTLALKLTSWVNGPCGISSIFESR